MRSSRILSCTVSFWRSWSLVVVVRLRGELSRLWESSPEGRKRTEESFFDEILGRPATDGCWCSPVLIAIVAKASTTYYTPYTTNFSRRFFTHRLLPHCDTTTGFVPSVLNVSATPGQKSPSSLGAHPNQTKPNPTQPWYPYLDPFPEPRPQR